MTLRPLERPVAPRFLPKPRRRTPAARGQRIGGTSSRTPSIAPECFRFCEAFRGAIRSGPAVATDRFAFLASPARALQSFAITELERKEFRITALSSLR